MNHVPFIEVMLFVDGQDHGAYVQLNVFELKRIRTFDEPSNCQQAFSGTLGEFLERISSICMHAESAGKREVYEEMAKRGFDLPCPACDELMTKENPLSEDALICETCRYS